MKPSLLVSIALASGLLLSACTVDAQLASQLLSSLQKTVDANTDEDGKTTLNATDLAEAADEAGVQVVCGGKEMSIASADDDEDEDDDSDDDSDKDSDEAVLKRAKRVHPVMFGYAPQGGQVQRIQIDINLANELSQLPNYQGAQRTQRYKQIQSRYPMMQNAHPVVYQGGGQSRQIVFAQYGGQQYGGQQYAGAPAHFMPGQPPQVGTRPAKTTSASARPVPATRAIPANFFSDLPGGKSPCTLKAKASDEDTSSEDSSDDSDDSEE